MCVRRVPRVTDLSASDFPERKVRSVEMEKKGFIMQRKETELNRTFGLIFPLDFFFTKSLSYFNSENYNVHSGTLTKSTRMKMFTNNNSLL